MSEWIKCDELLPEKGVPVIVACYGSDIVCPLEGETVKQTFDRLRREHVRVKPGILDGDGWYEFEGYPMIIQPLYWMPFPEPPEYEPDPAEKDSGVKWDDTFERIFNDI